MTCYSKQPLSLNLNQLMFTFTANTYCKHPGPDHISCHAFFGCIDNPTVSMVPLPIDVFNPDGPVDGGMKAARDVFKQL
jgi:hypothetical protein